MDVKGNEKDTAPTGQGGRGALSAEALKELTGSAFFGKASPEGFAAAWPGPGIRQKALEAARNETAASRELSGFRSEKTGRTAFLCEASPEGTGVLALGSVRGTEFEPDEVVPVLPGAGKECFVRGVRLHGNRSDGDAFLQPEGSPRSFSVAVPGLDACRGELARFGLKRFSLAATAARIVKLAGSGEKGAHSGAPGKAEAFAAPADPELLRKATGILRDDSSFYVFRSPVKKIGNVELLGAPLIRAEIVISGNPGGENEVTVPLYFGSRASGGAQIREGDLVAGVFWLFGFFGPAFPLGN